MQILIPYLTIQMKLFYTQCLSWAFIWADISSVYACTYSIELYVQCAEDLHVSIMLLVKKIRCTITCTSNFLVVMFLAFLASESICFFFDYQANLLWLLSLCSDANRLSWCHWGVYFGANFHFIKRATRCGLCVWCYAPKIGRCVDWIMRVTIYLLAKPWLVATI